MRRRSPPRRRTPRIASVVRRCWQRWRRRSRRRRRVSGLRPVVEMVVGATRGDGCRRDAVDGCAAGSNEAGIASVEGRIGTTAAGPCGALSKRRRPQRLRRRRRLPTLALANRAVMSLHSAPIKRRMSRPRRSSPTRREAGRTLHRRATVKKSVRQTSNGLSPLNQPRQRRRRLHRRVPSAILPPSHNFASKPRPSSSCRLIRGSVGAYAQTRSSTSQDGGRNWIPVRLTVNETRHRRIGTGAARLLVYRTAGTRAARHRWDEFHTACPSPNAWTCVGHGDRRTPGHSDRRRRPHLQH